MAPQRKKVAVCPDGDCPFAGDWPSFLMHRTTEHNGYVCVACNDMDTHPVDKANIMHCANSLSVQCLLCPRSYKIAKENFHYNNTHRDEVGLI